MAKLINVIQDEITAKGHSETISRAAKVLSPALRETALCFAARIAFADGRLNQGEVNSLLQTSHFMQIPDERTIEIVEVIRILQNPASA